MSAEEAASLEEEEASCMSTVRDGGRCDRRWVTRIEARKSVCEIRTEMFTFMSGLPRGDAHLCAASNEL